MATPEPAAPSPKPPPRGAQLLVWLDMEMSGLDPETCRPLEIATLVTDGDLEVVATGPDLVIHQSDAILAAMDNWNTEHHAKSGLTEAVRASRVTEAQAMAETLAFLGAYFDRGVSPCCGNSVGQDRRFLRKYMPELEDFFHYRNVDVSTVKELARRWFGVKPPEKQSAHRALDDIRESIAELAWYRRVIFRGSPLLGEVGIAGEPVEG